ncbi:MAG: DNA-binding NtrC family response regulator [Mariniblastus sp.]|jgi:DNA-binding NtrC family response regulator
MNSTAVLLVNEDNQQLRNMPQELSQLGYDVTTAVSALEGTIALAQHHFDIIVSDHEMNVESGLSFLSSVRQKYPHVAKVLVCENMEDQRFVEAKMRGSVNSVIENPCEPEFLHEHIQLALEDVSNRINESKTGVVVATFKKLTNYFKQPEF